VLSDLPKDSPEFKEALDDQWRNMEMCAHTKFDRSKPDYSKYMALDTKVGTARACWNSSIAAQSRRFLPQHGRYGRKNWRLARRAGGVPRRDAPEGIRDVEVAVRFGRSDRPRRG
jgi:hypothetical protein